MLAGRARRRSRLELLPQIEQIEATPLFDQSAIFDANDRGERDRHILGGWGNALKGVSMVAAYREPLRDPVALGENVLERHGGVGERRPKSVRPISLPLTGQRWSCGIEISPIARSEELLDDIRAPSTAHSLEETTDQRLVLFC